MPSEARIDTAAVRETGVQQGRKDLGEQSAAGEL